MYIAFRVGVIAYGEGCEELAIDRFYPSRRDDYIHVLNDFGLNDEFFIRHGQCKWHTLIPELDRIVKNWETINKFLT